MALIKLILLGAYIWGVWKFWTGFRRTNFQPTLSNRITLIFVVARFISV